MDPHAVSSAPVLGFLNNVYDGLVRMSKDMTIEPSLAESWEAIGDGEGWRFTLRQGVTFHDGATFDADDVLFTYHLIQTFPELDNLGLWANTLNDVVKVDSHTVQFQLKRADITAQWLIADQVIVPEHQWKDVDDPVNFTNPEPVGTGPFTEITLFTPEVYEQCRNPYYWEQGKPFIDCLRVPRFRDNDEALAALTEGTVDWAGYFIPDIEHTFISENPKHYHYWFPPYNNICLFLNTPKAPFDDVAFRRALSMAIDRDTLVDVATYGYATVSQYPTGLGEIYRDWYDPDVIASVGKVGTYAPGEAKMLLDQGGYADKDNDGFREQPDGTPLQVTIAVVGGGTDWETAVQMIVEYFKEIGINASMITADFQSWMECLQAGQYDIAIAWQEVHQSPWRTYYNLLSSTLIQERAESNSWSRWSSEETDNLLDAYVKTDDPMEHRAIIGQLQQIVADNVPFIPLFSNPSWYEYNDSRFIGWSTADNPFVRPMCYVEVPERLIHVLNLSLR
jgi:peptide/nickel transport system substrate-binding protein